MSKNSSLQELENTIITYPDFPKEGILFKDISPLFLKPELFEKTIHLMADLVKDISFNKILAIDARGFLFASALGLFLHKGIILCRKPSKLPGELLSASYEYEYASTSVSIQKLSLMPRDEVLVVDDILATGHTARAAYSLITGAGGICAGILFFGTITGLGGMEYLAKEKIDTSKVFSLLEL